MFALGLVCSDRENECICSVVYLFYFASKHLFLGFVDDAEQLYPKPLLMFCNMRVCNMYSYLTIKSADVKDFGGTSLL